MKFLPFAKGGGMQSGLSGGGEIKISATALPWAISTFLKHQIAGLMHQLYVLASGEIMAAGTVFDALKVAQASVAGMEKPLGA